jgi:hypothetical protein
MKEKLFIFGLLGLMLALLVGLNTMSYVQKESVPDSEAFPNRSTYNTGPTGTRAFHDLLASTGQDVMRWEEPVIKLNNANSRYVSTFVIVGKTRRPITEDEIQQILEWVEYGGILVLVDRYPPPEFLVTTAPWKIDSKEGSEDLTDEQIEILTPSVDPSNSKQMTDGADAAEPTQPTVYSKGVNAIQPSKFASSAEIEAIKGILNKSVEAPVIDGDQSIEPPPPAATSDSGNGDVAETLDKNNTGDPEIGTGTKLPNVNTVPSEIRTIRENADTPAQSDKDSKDDSTELNPLVFAAPVVHFGNTKKNILVDFPYGEGRIVYLTDPYILSNGGVKLVDNAQLGMNIFSTDGLVAFDEYHQGYGSGQNRMLSYFSDTPLVPIFLQLFLIVAVIMFSRSRRFARPLPPDEPNRLSKLEYVAAMAQLKRRTKAFDLAVENIYTDFRRRVSRLIGVDNSQSNNKILAEGIALRTSYPASEMEVLMTNCEDIVHGQATNKEVLRLTKKLREVENAMGLRRERTTFRK